MCNLLIRIANIYAYIIYSNNIYTQDRWEAYTYCMYSQHCQSLCSQQKIYILRKTFDLFVQATFNASASYV